MIWVRLLYLPLHLWVDSLLDAVGDVIGDFLMVDDESSDIMHSTYVRILVEVDISKGLPRKIKVAHPKGFWIQTLDYEGISFRFRKCFNTSHLAA